MKISSILTSKGDFVATVAPDSSVTDLLALLAEHRIGAVVVSDDGTSVTGIVSERDIARAVHTHGAGALQHPVRDIMTADVVTCEPDATTGDLMGMMTQRRIRHIPVLVDGQLVGIVSIGDIVKARKPVPRATTTSQSPNPVSRRPPPAPARSARCTPGRSTGCPRPLFPGMRSTRRCASRRSSAVARTDG